MNADTSVLEIRCINPIPTRFIVRVQQLEALLFGHRTHTKTRPFIADTHTSQADGRQVDTRGGCQLTVATKFSFRCRCYAKE